MYLESFAIEPAESDSSVSVQEQIQPDTVSADADEPDPRRAQWAAERDAIKWIDLSSDTERHVIVAEGTADTYQGHVTTTLLADGRTMFAFWNLGHGGQDGPAAMSKDGGLTWQRIDERLLPEWSRTWNCPSIYRMTTPDRPEILRVFAAFGENGFMPSLVSTDDGESWQWQPPLAPLESTDFQNVMTFASMVRLQNGDYLGLYHGFEGKWIDAEPPLTREKFSAAVRKAVAEKRPGGVFQAISKDGGATWSSPRVIASGGHHLSKGEPRDQSSPKYFCEPYVFRSPGGEELCAILRENNRTGTSYMIFSQDEGGTWSEPQPTPWALTGDRHQGIHLPDGRQVIVFRDMAPDSPTRPHFVAWVGTYDDIKSGKLGQYRVKLLHSYAGGDNGYPGIELLPDGTIVATTYIKYWDDKRQHSIVSTRFTAEELDERGKTKVTMLHPLLHPSAFFMFPSDQQTQNSTYFFYENQNVVPAFCSRPRPSSLSGLGRLAHKWPL